MKELIERLESQIVEGKGEMWSLPHLKKLVSAIRSVAGAAYMKDPASGDVKSGSYEGVENGLRVVAKKSGDLHIKLGDMDDPDMWPSKTAKKYMTRDDEIDQEKIVRDMAKLAKRLGWSVKNKTY